LPKDAHCQIWKEEADSSYSVENILRLLKQATVVSAMDPINYLLIRNSLRARTKWGSVHCLQKKLHMTCFYICLQNSIKDANPEIYLLLSAPGLRIMGESSRYFHVFGRFLENCRTPKWFCCISTLLPGNYTGRRRKTFEKSL